MAQQKPDPSTVETGEQVPARPHDSGSQANETVEGLDASTEALRHAAEDTPTGTGPGDVEKTPVFDRADLAPIVLIKAAGRLEPPVTAAIVSLQEAIMSHWHDSMVDRPETDGAVYVTGWTISGLAVLGVILVVWVFAI
jgi:hypothetical protein